MAPYASIFVISLSYTGSLAEIDSLMDKHMLFLNRQYKAGHFLVSGRLVPRTGGIIIARGADKKSIERIMKTDPFCKNRLATVEITQFLASQQSDTIKHWLDG